MSRRVFGNAPGLKPMSMGPAFGEPIYEIIIDVDKRGLMRTRLTKYPTGNPPTQLHVLGMLLDSMQGQFQGMIKSASMIIDPNNKPPMKEFVGVTEVKEQPNGGEKEKDDNGSRGNSSGGNGGN